MSISRRGFFGSLLGLFGLGGVAKAAKPLYGKSPLVNLRSHLDTIEVIDRARWEAMKRYVKPFQL